MIQWEDIMTHQVSETEASWMWSENQIVSLDIMGRMMTITKTSLIKWEYLINLGIVTTKDQIWAIQIIKISRILRSKMLDHFMMEVLAELVGTGSIHFKLPMIKAPWSIKLYWNKMPNLQDGLMKMTTSYEENFKLNNYV